MKERPILFNAEMVRAILDGRKTQTRRPFKFQPPDREYILATCICTTGDSRNKGKHHWVKLATGGYRAIDGKQPYFSCPYGQSGDRLWVRETTLADHEFHEQIVAAKYAADGTHVLYSGPETYDDGEPAYGGSLAHWWYSKPACPSIHMPRWASRILLEITNVRVERVQDITERDAMAEGAPWEDCWSSYRQSFEALWCRTYGPQSWDTNPWVWVIEFRRIEA